MRPEWNRKYNTILLYACAAAGIVVVLVFLATHFDFVSDALKKAREILSPLLIGVVTAYLMNPLVRWLENKAFTPLTARMKKPRPRMARPLSILTAYLLDLAKAFNRFYREKQVLNAEDPNVRAVRLALCCAVRDILTDGLRTLTLGIPEAM